MSSGNMANPMHSWAVTELARMLRKELERVNIAQICYQKKR